MAQNYNNPGIYIIEKPFVPSTRPIEGVDTAVAGFIGFTEDVRNGAQIGEAMLVTSWGEYLRYFASPGSDGFTDFNAYLPFAVYGYFLNGGGRCWIVSIGTQLPGTSQPTEQQIASVRVPGHGNRPCLNLFSLCAEQADLGAVQIVIGDSRPRALPPRTEGEPPPNTGEYFSLQLRRGDEVLEQYDNLTMNPTPPEQVATYVVEALRSSRYVQVVNEAQPGQPLNCRPQNGQYELSPPLIVTTPDQFLSNLVGVQDDRTGVHGIFEIDEITMIACPDLMRAYEAGIMNLDQEVRGIMELMISKCVGLINGEPSPPNRMVVLDPPPDRVKPQQMVEWLEFGRRSMFAALYYPRIKVRNPRNGRSISVPPCGHMMGVWARTDQMRGIHTAPANEVLKGVIGLAYNVSYQEQELLNSLGINCICEASDHSIRILGARTLVEPDITEWRYISVRRLISYIEKSIELGTQWAVFEPNDSQLWEKVQRLTSKFLERLWREGALFGARPQEAFFVKCNAENNTPDTIKLNRVYIDVGVAPMRPAEFVIFRISQYCVTDTD